jgi:hypothetical protein
MTKVTKPVVRETAAEYQHRPIVASLGPKAITLRLKGTREALTVDYPSIIELAYKRLHAAHGGRLRRAS